MPFVDARSAVEVFRRLSGAPSIDALLDSILQLARQYGDACDVCVLLADGAAYRLAALAMAGAVLPAGVRELLGGAAPAPGDAGLCLALEDGAGYLYCWRDSGLPFPPAQGDTLGLIAACGAIGLRRLSPHKDDPLVTREAAPPEPDAAGEDALTGLPKRRLLLDRLTQALAMGERGKFVIAVAHIELDRLAFVNATLGRAAGDLLLQTVARRMSACVRKSDTVGRLGGDTFVLVSMHRLGVASAPGERPAIAPDDDDFSYIEHMLAKIRDALSQAVRLGGQDFDITCSIGVSLFPRDGDDAHTLLRHADGAMQQARQNGCNLVAFHAEPPATGTSGRAEVSVFSP